MHNGTIRIGLIGAGANTTLRHIPGFRGQPDVEIVAVANRSRQSGERIAGEYEIPRVYDNWADLLNDDGIDAVCIGTWPYMHRNLVLASLSVGQACADRGPHGHERRRGPRDAGRQPPAPRPGHPDRPGPADAGGGQHRYRLRGQRLLGRHPSRPAPRLRLPRPLQPRPTPSSIPIPPCTGAKNRNLSGYNILGMGIWYETIMRYVGPATKVSAMTRTFANRRPDENGVMQAVTVPDHVNVLCEMGCGAAADFSWSTVTGLQTGTDFWIFGTDGTISLQGPPFNTVLGRQARRRGPRPPAHH